MSFSSHGGLKIWVEDNIVFMEISGGWNLEKAKEFIWTLNNKVFPLITAPYCAIGLLDDNWMPTADAIPYLHEATKRAIKAGLVKEAYVSSSKISSRVTESFVLPSNTQDYQRKEFTTLEQAVDWVKGTDKAKTDTN